MPGAPSSPDYAACSGCSLCRLVCPMWRRTRDPAHSPEGIAKAQQCGAVAADLGPVLAACSLCGACDAVCPEAIDLTGMFLRLRRKLPAPAAMDGLRERLNRVVDEPLAPRSAELLVPGADLRADAALRRKVQGILGLVAAPDDGADLALALEAGVEIPPERIGHFLVGIAGHRVVVEDGLLLHQLRRWLPESKRLSLGVALSSHPGVREKLGPGDLYVIEPRAYHAEQARMVRYYDALRHDTGCALNLDLQRIAVPATAHGLAQRLGLAAADGSAEAAWLLRGRDPQRIVVESAADRVALEAACDVPVVHVAELVEA